MDESHKMGFLGATSYVIGNIIGSGIFITPASILRNVDSIGLSLLIWVLCAVIAILGAICYIELGTSIREAGCDFAYICYVKWYSIAFAFMWVSVLMTYPATIAICAETFGQYLIEGLKQYYEIDDALVPTCQKLFAYSLLFLVTWMNFFELSKFAARFQILATIAKLFSCMLIIGTGFYFYFVKGWHGYLENPMQGSKYGTGNLILGFYGGLWAFSGWDVLNYSTGEIKHPKRNVPFALLTGISVVTAIYVAINVAYFVVLDVETVKQSDAVAAIFSRETLGDFANVVPFLIGILLIGSLNSNLFSGSRYMYAAARQGHLPACFSCVNTETESPRVAVLAQSVLALVISYIGDLDTLITYVMFGFWAQRIFSLVALLIIRHNHIPVHPDAVRVPLFCIYLFLAITVALVIIPIFYEFQSTALAIAICLFGFVLYYVFIHKAIFPRWLVALNKKVTLWCCILFDCLPDVKGGVQLLASDSSQALLSERLSSTRLSDDSFPDLHSDEKNIMRRNGSAAGLKMLISSVPSSLVDLISDVQ
ncbi:Amino Acid Transporter [Caenorhabditis elegans]|uniref:Amino Acid Transporter n=1 Tax=Caenorhabditis elegans TaxID=6239 RepID=H2KZG9_CAEEL|nr:Amino Acid Transporter [Caenorhabditis elegans]CCD68122.1 Amino Acid Transporter [Caenorhabditis elegans]|eukprot:NP_491002.2 Amino Acid Transporter [Caenorhabditis elegans]